MPRDYYEILGVDRKAEPGQIKKAYRRLAKKHHPDVDKTEGAATRFNEIQEAYDVLNDPDKRKRYDRFGHAGVHAEADPFASGGATTYTTPGGFSFNAEGMGEGFSLDDVFSQFFGGSGPRAKANPFQGRGAAGSRGYTTARSRPADQHHTIHVPFDTALSGGSVALKLSGINGTQNIDVKIPKGIGDGAHLRLRGKGGGGADLILTIRIDDHPYFTRRGLDLNVDVPISVPEALFGASVDVPTPTGKAALKIPPKTGGGAKLRLKGAGVDNAKGERGDLYARIRIDIPGDLEEKDLQTLKSLQDRWPDPRRNVRW